ncbi:MAG: PilW family protein [Panacagrimonas sp.]
MIKNRQPGPLTLQRSAGFSLVELMIAVVIGLIVVASIATVFVSSRQTFMTQQALAELQETGRLLNFLVYPYLRQAGYVSDPLIYLDPSQLFVADPNPAVDRRALWGADNASSGALGLTSLRANTDVIVTRFFMRDSPSDSEDLKGVFYTCTGGPPPPRLPAPDDLLMLESTFYVRQYQRDKNDRADEGVGSLNCRGRIYTYARMPDGTFAVSAPEDKGTEPLVRGVQNMQLLYGIDTDDDRAPNQYVAANLVPDWTRVVTIRAEITVAGARATEGAFAGPLTENSCENADLMIDKSGRIQRCFTTTLQIRNLLKI